MHPHRPPRPLAPRPRPRARGARALAGAAAAAVLALAPAAAPAAEWTGRASLHGRATGLRDLPGPALRYDVAARAFDLAGYLAPREDDPHGSLFAAVGVEGRLLGGALRLVLAADTGELRRRRFPELAAVCLARLDRTPAGLDVVGGGSCTLAGAAAPLPLEETRLGPSVVTANGRPVAEEGEATGFVREAYLAAAFGRARFAELRAGRRRTAVGAGFVFDDYATGVEARADLGAIGPPLDLSLALFFPTREAPRLDARASPMLALRVDLLPSLFEHAGVFAAVHRDRTGGVAELFRGAIVERLVEVLGPLAPGTLAYQTASRTLAGVLAAPLESDATVAWLGATGTLAPWRGARLSFAAALSEGRLDALDSPASESPRVAEDVALRGRMAHLRVEQDVHPRVSLSAFGLYLSGGELPVARERDPATGELLPASGTYRGFLGIAPFLTATNLFFGGGLSETFAARQASAPGVNGRGVAAAGLGLAWDPRDDLSLEVKTARLVAPVAGPGGGTAYGDEVDLLVTWAPRDWIVLGAEWDALALGDFFPERGTVRKVVLAVDLVTP